MTYYYNIEAQQIETEEAIKKDYALFGSEYESYKDFLSACMWYNNGSLIPIQEGFTKCRFAIGHCTESEQKLVFIITNVNTESQRLVISCINSCLPIQPSEIVSIHQIELI